MKTISTKILLICLILQSILAIPATDLDFTFIKVDQVEQKAKCLNGQDYGLYYQKADSNKFLIMFEGGGWCGGKLGEDAKVIFNIDSQIGGEWLDTEEEAIQSCFKRSTSLAGGIKFPQFTVDGLDDMEYKIFHKNKENNPLFHDYNKIYLPYCDGMGHQGYVSEPIERNGEKIYIRGERNAKQSIKYAMENLGLKNAERVVVNGYSAGGIAAMQYSTYVKEQDYLNKNIDVKLIVDSSIFLDEKNIVTQKQSYKIGVQNVVKVANKETQIVMKKCHEHYSSTNEQYKCFIADTLMEFIEMPTFLLMSTYDWWVGESLLGVNCDIFKINSIKDQRSCTKQDLEALENYSKHQIEVTRKFLNKNKNWGCYSHPCPEHGYSYFTNTMEHQIIGAMHLQKALDNWLNEKTDVQQLYIDSQKWNPNLQCDKVNDTQKQNKIEL